MGLSCGTGLDRRPHSRSAGVGLYFQIRLLFVTEVVKAIHTYVFIDRFLSLDTVSGDRLPSFSSCHAGLLLPEGSQISQHSFWISFSQTLTFSDISFSQTLTHAHTGTFL